MNKSTEIFNAERFWKINNLLNFRFHWVWKQPANTFNVKELFSSLIVCVFNYQRRPHWEIGRRLIKPQHIIIITQQFDTGHSQFHLMSFTDGGMTWISKYIFFYVLLNVCSNDYEMISIKCKSQQMFFFSIDKSVSMEKK
jgi:hypothetical protein